jgi:hypothetical protein
MPQRAGDAYCQVQRRAVVKATGLSYNAFRSADRSPKAIIGGQALRIALLIFSLSLSICCLEPASERIDNENEHDNGRQVN